jgi:hypothetical protein
VIAVKLDRALVGAVVLLVASPSFGQPLLRYTFDEASGNAIDSGLAPLTDSTFQGGATRSPDTPSGSGSSLDMRDDASYAHLLGGDFADLDGLEFLTLTTWLKVESFPDATIGNSANKRLLAKQAGQTDSFAGFSFNMNATTNSGNPASPGEFRLGFFTLSSSTLIAAFSDADVGAADWTFLAVTYDAVVGEVMFYAGDVDSPVTQVGSTFDTGFPNANLVDGLNARFAVGLTDAATTSDNSVTGLQDDVRVYGTALNLAELEQVRLEGLVPEPGSMGLATLAAMCVAARGRRQSARTCPAVL